MTGWGYHEVEFAYRLTQTGALVVYDPAAGVFHREHTPESEAGRGLDRPTILQADTARNEAYLLRKHALPRLPRW
jgi:hypothetical protein